MKEITTLLLDVDNTLLDFQMCQDHALRKAFEKYQITLTDEIYECYNEINHGLWKQLERGEIDRDTVLYSRFVRLFEKLGIDADGIAFEDDYQALLGEGAFLIEGAMQLIHYLYDHYDLYIVTNGVAATQYKRLKDSGIDEFMKDIFISESIGYQKPDIRFFDYCFEKIQGFEKDKTMIIGDTLTSDILGGNNAGITTCWYNPDRLENNTEAVVDIEINQLDDLYTFL